VGGLHDDRERSGLVADALEYGHAVGAGHDEIEENEAQAFGFGAFEDGNGLIAALSNPCLVSETLYHLFENATLGWVVIDDEDALDQDAWTLLTDATYEPLPREVASSSHTCKSTAY
jgi:hypothetical protein